MYFYWTGFYHVEMKLIIYKLSEFLNLSLPSTENGVCKNCDYTCKMCNGPSNTDCLSCDYYRFLTDEQRCEEVCPVNFYPDFDLNTCNKCHETCEGCVQGGPSDCLECKPGKMEISVFDTFHSFWNRNILISLFSIVLVNFNIKVWKLHLKC